MRKSIQFWFTALAVMIIFAVAGLVVAKFPGIGTAELSQKPLLTMLAICFGTFVSEDLTTISAGLIAASGILNYGQSVIAAFSGIFIGDMIIFWLGYHFGRPLLAHRWSRLLVSERAVNRAQHLFHKNGFWIIILTRFLPGTRSATYFAAGAVHAPVVPFIGAFALAAAIWTPFLVGVSYYIGTELLELYEVYEALALPVLLFAVLLLYFIFHYGLPLLTWKGRRRLRGKWIRAMKWEFWPAWQVYWYVALYIFWTGLTRYRNPLLFTAVNPGMPDGGIIGESKSAILKGLSGAGECLPPWCLIGEGALEDRLREYDSALRRLGLDYPVVLKPDEGQRGAGVKIVRSRQQAMEWLEKHPHPAILQGYANGTEYGIFYIRYPSRSTGEITSITLKKQLFVEGNGKDSLEMLIYKHPRAIVLLGTFLDRFVEDLEKIPEDGEAVFLGELGTHARGSLFLDGNHLITDKLLHKIQEVADHYHGFYFGRFDVKAPGDEALKRGEGIQIIELNGVTSEETHIYDPQHGLPHAWKCLCRQWRTAFEIASENVLAGHRPTPFTCLIKHLVAARRRQRTHD